MLQRFKAGYQVKLSVGTLRVCRHHRIVCHRHRETVGAKPCAEQVIAPAEVEDAHFCLVLAPHAHQSVGIRMRPWPHVIWIDLQVVFVVDVGFELLIVPAVECIGKKKIAGHTAAVIDRDARERQLLMAFVKVDDAVELGVLAAYLARYGLR